MKKLILLVLPCLLLTTGCGSINFDKLMDQGMKAAEKAVKKEADKQIDKYSGKGTSEDYDRLKAESQDKCDRCLTYFSKINIAYDKKQIDKETKKELKQKVEDNYAELAAKKISSIQFTENCDKLLKDNIKKKK